jgi:hypothetical protein
LWTLPGRKQCTMSSSFPNTITIPNFRSISLTVLEFWKRYHQTAKNPIQFPIAQTPIKFKISSYPIKIQLLNIIIILFAVFPIQISYFSSSYFAWKQNAFLSYFVYLFYYFIHFLKFNFLWNKNKYDGGVRWLCSLFLGGLKCVVWV